MRRMSLIAAVVIVIPLLLALADSQPGFSSFQSDSSRVALTGGISKDAALGIMKKTMKSEGLSHVALIGDVLYARPLGGGNGKLIAHFMSTKPDSTIWFVTVDEHLRTTHVQHLGAYPGFYRQVVDHQDLVQVKAKVRGRLGDGYYSEFTLWLFTEQPDDIECYGCSALFWDFLRADPELTKVTHYYAFRGTAAEDIVVYEVPVLQLDHFKLLQGIDTSDPLLER